MLNPFPQVDWIFPFCPSESNWSIDWTSMLGQFEWLRNLSGCPQNPDYHAEGDVLTHTKLVCEALVSLSSWQGLTKETRSIIFLAALLHDVAKPAYTKIDTDGHISSHGHVQNGAKMARRILWEMEVPFYFREMIVALVRQSSLPFYLLEKPDPQFSIIQASQTARLDWLAILSQADTLGRKCKDQKDLLDKIELFSEFSKEQQCFGFPKEFPSAHSRFFYFQKGGGNPNHHAYNDTCLEVVLMCGLPASGKDNWIKNNLATWPVVSLDEIRRELKTPPHKNQGEVIRESKERARGFLREKKSFVWNATNTLRLRRSQLISLFSGYQARIRIVYLETNPTSLLKRNHKRDETVPKKVIEKMLDNLEIPDLTEAHQVEWIIT